MSEEVASTAAAEPASAPAAPAETGTASSTDFSYSKVSDDQILDMGSESEPEEEKKATGEAPVEAKPAETKSVPDQKTVETPKADPDAPVQEVLEPEELKNVFKEHPSLRHAFYREKAFTEVFPTVAEARAMKEVFPTADMAKQAAQHQAMLFDLDLTYQKNPAEFVAKLHQGNPGAFRAMIEAARPTMYQADPDMYRESYAKPVFNDVVANLRDYAIQSGDQQLQAALDILDDRRGYKQQVENQGIAAQDPRVRAYENLQAKAKELAANNRQAFEAGVQNAYWEGLSKYVSEAVGTPKGMSPAAVKMAVDEVIREVTGFMSTRNDLRGAYEAQLRGPDISPKRQQEIADYLLQYAKQAVPVKVKARLDAWTKEILRINQEELAKKAAVPVKKDIGSGGGTSDTSSRPKKINYKKMSDNDILEM